MNIEINPVELEALMDQAFLEGPSSASMEKLKTLLAQYPEHRTLWEEYREIRRGLHLLEENSRPGEAILATLRQAARKPQVSTISTLDAVTHPPATQVATEESLDTPREIQIGSANVSFSVSEPEPQYDKQNATNISISSFESPSEEPLEIKFGNETIPVKKSPWNFSEGLQFLQKLGRYLLRTPTVSAATLTFFLVVGLSSRYLLKEHPSPLDNADDLTNATQEISPEKLTESSLRRPKTKSILPASHPQLLSGQNEGAAAPPAVSIDSKSSKQEDSTPPHPKKEMAPGLADSIANSAPPPSPGDTSAIQTSEKTALVQNNEPSAEKRAKSSPSQTDYIASAKKKMRAGNYKSALADLRKAQSQNNTKEVKRLIAECQRKMKSQKKKK